MYDDSHANDAAATQWLKNFVTQKIADLTQRGIPLTEGDLAGFAQEAEAHGRNLASAAKREVVSQTTLASKLTDEVSNLDPGHRMRDLAHAHINK